MIEIWLYAFVSGKDVPNLVFNLQQTFASVSAASGRSHMCRCGRTYKQISSLNRHMRYECGQTKKNHECHLCGRKYYRPDTLQEHFQNCMVKYRERMGGECDYPMSKSSTLHNVK